MLKMEYLDSMVRTKELLFSIIFKGRGDKGLSLIKVKVKYIFAGSFEIFERSFYFVAILYIWPFNSPFRRSLVPNSSVMALWGGIWEQNKRLCPKFRPTTPL